jgi:hypothetical protein
MTPMKPTDAAISKWRGGTPPSSMSRRSFAPATTCSGDVGEGASIARISDLETVSRYSAPFG